MNLTMKRMFCRAGFISPKAGLPPINNGTILTTTIIVWFARVPMFLCNGRSVGPGPLALMTMVSGSNPLQVSISGTMSVVSWIFGEISIDGRMVVINEEPSKTGTEVPGVPEAHRLGIVLEVSPTDQTDPAIRICLCR